MYSSGRLRRSVEARAKLQRALSTRARGWLLDRTVGNASCKMFPRIKRRVSKFSDRVLTGTLHFWLTCWIDLLYSQAKFDLIDCIFLVTPSRIHYPRRQSALLLHLGLAYEQL